MSARLPLYEQARAGSDLMRNGAAVGRRSTAKATAFTEFVDYRSKSLLRTAYLLVGDHGLAQDLLQEALIKTYVAWGRLEDPGNAEAYARRVLVTTAVSWHRRRSSSERPQEDVREHPRPDATEAVSERDAVWRELQALPPRQRAAIVLRFYEDLTDAQAAEVMGCAVGTVSSQVSQGLRTLRDRVGTGVSLLTVTEEGARR